MSFTGLIQRMIMTADGFAFFQGRSEFVSEKLEKNVQNGFFVAPLFRLWGGNVVGIDAHKITRESFQQITSGTEDPKIRQVYLFFFRILGIRPKDPVGWFATQAEDSIEGRHLLLRHFNSSQVKSTMLKKLEACHPSRFENELFLTLHQVVLETLASVILRIDQLPEQTAREIECIEDTLFHETPTMSLCGKEWALTDSQKKFQRATELFSRIGKSLIESNVDQILANEDSYLYVLADQEAKKEGKTVKQILENPPAWLTATPSALFLAGSNIATAMCALLLRITPDNIQTLKDSESVRKEFFRECTRLSSPIRLIIRSVSLDTKLTTVDGEPLVIPKNSLVFCDLTSKKTGDRDLSFSSGKRSCPAERAFAIEALNGAFQYLVNQGKCLRANDSHMAEFGNAYWTITDTVTRPKKDRTIVAKWHSF